jgi:phospholipid/cholesterol/gamma-HCH transport system substrate-binding protein
VLGSGGVETVQLGNGLLGFPLFPVEGVNPPMPASRPPLRADVACETQEPPNLNTVPGAAPASHRVDTSSAAFKERYEKAKQTAIVALRANIRASGSKVKVSDTEATRGLIDALARRAGNAAQLEVLRSGDILNHKNLRKAGAR